MKNDKTITLSSRIDFREPGQPSPYRDRKAYAHELSDQEWADMESQGITWSQLRLISERIPQ